MTSPRGLLLSTVFLSVMAELTATTARGGLVVCMLSQLAMAITIHRLLLRCACEPVWPSGKALGW